ncbi:hypothetical protein D3C79_835190 [compost metagenome]
MAHSVIIGAYLQANGFADQAWGHVETLGHITVFGVALDAPIAVGAGTGDRDALADLDQRRLAFAGLDLLQATIPVAGAVMDDARIATVVLIVAVVVVDADHQALGRGVQLLQQGAQVVYAFGAGSDDQLVLEGADATVLANERLGSGQQFGAAAVLQRQHFGGGLGGQAGGQQQGS